jgi:hypothetical protein
VVANSLGQPEWLDNPREDSLRVLSSVPGMTAEQVAELRAAGVV